MKRILLILLLSLCGLTPAQKRIIISADPYGEAACDQYITQQGPTLWLDADRDSTITSSSTAVSAWASRYGAVSFTQATGGNQPALTRRDGRENRLTYSEDLTNAAWNNVRTTDTATTILTTAAGSNSYYAWQRIATVAGEIYTLDATIKKIDYDYAYLNIYDGTTHKRTWFKIGDGTLGTAAAGVTASITSAGADGYLCRMTVAAGASSTTTGYVELGLSAADNATDFNPAGAGLGTQFKYMQFRSALADSSYQATTTYAQYRGVNGRRAVRFDGVDDLLSATDIIGTDAFSIFVASRPATVDTVGRRLLDNGRFYYWAATSGGNPYLYLTGNNSTVVSSAVSEYISSKPHVSAITRTAAGVANFYIDGKRSGTADQNSGSPTAATTALTLGASTATASRVFLGDLQTLLTFNKVLPADIRAKINRCLCRKAGASC